METAAKAVGWFWDKSGTVVDVIPKEGETPDEAIKRVTEHHGLPASVVKPMERKAAMTAKPFQGGGKTSNDGARNPKDLRADYSKAFDAHKPTIGAAEKPGYRSTLAPNLKGDEA